MKANLSSIQTKIIPIIFGLALFAVAFSAVKGMVYGNVTNVKMLAGLVVVGGIVFVLDKYYWLLYPAFYTLGIKLPGLPFDGSELGCIFLIGIYTLRLALQKEKTTKPCTFLLLCFPFLLWIFIVWCLNPTGLAMFGSSTIGARFYLQIVLSFLACCVMCAKVINEEDAKKLFVIIVIAQFVNAFISLFLTGLVTTNDEGEMKQGQYQFLFALSFYTFMFCRYSLSDVFKFAWKFFAVVFLALLTIYTGKRRAIGTLLLLPILRVFFTGKDKVLTFACVCIASFLLIFTVAADGAFYELPPSVKRSLSVVVPKYRQSQVVLDEFRYEVRNRGNELIKESPWFGRKGFAMDFREAVWMNSNKSDFYGGHAYAGNWHSTWYAFACDFGLPCMILFIFPFVYSLVYSYKLLKKCKYGSWSFVCVLYYSFSLYIFAIFSYTTGHSSGSTTTILFNIGILTALGNGLKQDRITMPVSYL